MDPKLLILDLDETLVYATKHPLNRKEDSKAGQYFVYRRPFLESFLEFAFEHFHVSVWTSAGKGYAQDVVNHTFSHPEQLRFLWTEERCTLRSDPETRELCWIKDLKKVKRFGYSLNSILIVDDSPEKLQRNYGNHIRIKAFEGALADTELLQLQKFLASLKDVPNVRVVDKRTWKKVCNSRHPRNLKRHL